MAGIRKQVKKLNVQDGDIVVVSMPRKAMEQGESALAGVAEALKVAGVKKTTLLCIERGVKLEALDEADMAAAGWVRKTEEVDG
jgi:hypothetical protein